MQEGSRRRYEALIRVARTFADLEKNDLIKSNHIEESANLTAYSFKKMKENNYTHLLVWKILQKVQSEGYKTFDFMGANTPKIIDFKKSFGGKLVTYYNLKRYSSSFIKTLFEINDVIHKLEEIYQKQVEDILLVNKFEKIKEFVFNTYRKSCHGDLHSENFFWDGTNAYLIDFGKLLSFRNSPLQKI